MAGSTPKSTTTNNGEANNSRTGKANTGNDSNDTPIVNEEDDEAPIPLLTAVAASIFVPNTLDYSAPVPPRRIDRLPIAIAQLDHHASGARANMVALLEREHTRITRAARLEERTLAAAGLKEDPTRASIIASSNDIDAMIANMEAPIRPATGSCITNVPDIPFPVNVGATSREWAANEVMRLTKAALTDLRNFDKHVNERRETYELALKREQDRRPAS